MQRFWTGAGSVILAMGLAYGWTWTGLLKDFGWINDAGRVTILSAITVLFFFQQVWLVLPKPVDRESVEARRAVISNYLQAVLAAYYTKLQSLAARPNDPVPAVRINLMLPTKRAKGLFGSFLRMYYHACPRGVAYSDREKALHWGKGKATSGWAWKHGGTTIYDSGSPEYQGPAQRLSPEQKKAVESIKSVLSVPIREKGKIVGVMNLDSKHEAVETHFTDDAILGLVEVYGRDIGPLCFPDGVKA
jgi:hypothetical protein